MDASLRLTYDGYQAWIEVEGQALQCYSTDVDHVKKTVTCWIASEAGKTFSIGCQPNNSKEPSRARVYLDGMLMKCIWWDKEITRYPHLFRHFNTSNTTVVPFMFSALELTDDDNYLEATPCLANIGEIKLVFHSIMDPVQKLCDSNKCSTCARHFKNYECSTPTVEKVHERSKKALAHRIGFGDEQPKMNQRSKKFLPAHFNVKEHLITFIFRYRPLDVLQANDIVPRIPDSVVPSQDNDPSSSISSQSSKGKRKARDLSQGMQESVKIFEDRENALLAELGRLQDEKEQFLLAELEKLRKDKCLIKDNSPRKKVKKETKPLVLSGEVIDLT